MPVLPFVAFVAFHPLAVSNRPRNDVKFAWKVQRDVAERGWTEEQVPQCGSSARGLGLAFGDRWRVADPEHPDELLLTCSSCVFWVGGHIRFGPRSLWDMTDLTAAAWSSVMKTRRCERTSRSDCPISPSTWILKRPGRGGRFWRGFAPDGLWGAEAILMWYMMDSI